MSTEVTGSYQPPRTGAEDASSATGVQSQTTIAAKLSLLILATSSSSEACLDAVIIIDLLVSMLYSPPNDTDSRCLCSPPTLLFQFNLLFRLGFLVSGSFKILNCFMHLTEA